MKPPRALVTVLVLGVLASCVGGFAGSVAAQQDLAVTTVNVTPADPAPGERVQFSTTIENLQSSNETVRITDVYLRHRGGGELARVEDLGSVAAGSSMTVPMSVTFDEVGEKDLRLHVVARDSERFQRIEYPVQVTVGEPSDVNVAIDADDFVAGEESRVNVTVANGGDGPISNVEVILGGDGQVDNPRRVSGSIPADTDREYSFDVTFEDAGTGTLNASLGYAKEGRVSRTVTDSMAVTIEPAGAGTEGRIQLTGVETTSAGDRITIQGDAANVGTTDAQSVLLSVQEADGVTPVQPSREFFIGTVEGSEFGTFELTAAVDPSVSSIPVLVEWTVDDERKSESFQIDVEDGFDPTRGGQSPSDGPDGSQGSGLLGLPVMLGLGLVVVVLGGGYYLWKR